MYIGWQKCRVYEDLNLGRCFNCNDDGHSAKKCNNETSCAHCADKHSTTFCPNKNLKKCINCIKANEKYHTSKNIDHHAYDENICSRYSFFANISKSKTDY